MNPPIASPHEDPKSVRPLSKRLEWSAEDGCVRLLFLSPLLARARCELIICRYNHYFKIGLPFFFLTFLALWITQMAKSKARPDEFHLCSWGIREIYGGNTTEIPWSAVVRVIEQNGNVVILRRPFYKCCYFVTREDFADLQESKKFAATVDSLRQSQGASWPTIRAQFETS